MDDVVLGEATSLCERMGENQKRRTEKTKDNGIRFLSSKLLISV